MAPETEPEEQQGSAGEHPGHLGDAIRELQQHKGSVPGVVGPKVETHPGKPGAGADDLEKQFQKPSYTGHGAGDNQKPGGGASKPEEAATKAVGAAVGGNIGKQAASFIGNNKKKLLLAGGGLAVVAIPLILLFILLSLFKLNDIEKLAMDRQYLKVNRAIGARARELVNEAKETGPTPATGTPDTEVDIGSGDLATEISQLNGAEINEQAANPASLNSALSQVEDANNSTAGVGGQIDGEFDIDRDIEPIDDQGKDEDQLLDEVKESDRAAVQNGIEPDGGPLPDSSERIEEDVTNNLADPEAAMVDEAPKINLLKGVTSFGAFDTIAVYYCIGEDIYGQAFGKLAQTRTTELVRLAARTFTAADAEKEGKLSVGQVGGYNQLFDSGGQSFTQSAAYRRDTNQPVDSDPSSPDYNPDLTSSARPFDSDAGTVLTTLADIFSPPGISGAIGDVCGVVLQPAAQFTGAILEYAGSVAADLFTGDGATLTEEGALAAIKESMWTVFKETLTTKTALKSGAQITATYALQLVAAQSAANHAGAATTGTELPTSRFNKVDAGTDIMANETSRLMGGQQLSSAQSASLENEQLASEQSHESLADHIFSTSNPNSIASTTLAAIPTDPATALNQFGSYLGNIFKPTTWAESVLQIFGGGTAQADSDGDPYGIPQYGFTDAELSQYNIVQNSNYIMANPAIAQKYQACFQGGAGAFVNFAGGQDSALCNSNDPDLTRYRIYLLDKQVVADYAILYSQTNTQSAGSTQ